MTGKTKRNILLLLGLTMIVIMVIAASLPALELQPGMPLPEVWDGEILAAGLEEQPTVRISLNQFFFVLMGIFLAIGLIYMLAAVIRGANWRSILSFLRLMLGAILVISILLILILLMPHGTTTTEMQMQLPTPAPVVTAPLGPVPPLLLWIVGACLLMIGGGIVFWILRTGRSRPTTMDLLGWEAEKARQDLEIGVGLKDVIIRCYRKMSLILEDDQGIEREAFMTTGEFENILTEAGIPHDPIRQLTRLFEAARYGNWQPLRADEEKAIHSLEEIINYSRRQKATKEAR